MWAGSETEVALLGESIQKLAVLTLRSNMSVAITLYLVEQAANGS